MNIEWKLFVKNRLDRKVFMGLPLTVFVIIFLILLSTFIGITSLIVSSSLIVKLDFSFTLFIYLHRNASLQNIFYHITNFANRSTIEALLVVVLAYLFFTKERAYLYAVLVVVLGNEVTVSLIKIIINRTRPALDPTYFIEKAKSFPSGHAAIAMAFFGFVTYYLFQHVAGKNKKSIILLLGALLIMLIGFSRIYLGVHYLSDVLGGFLLGSLWLVAGIAFRQHHFYTNSIKKEKTDF